MKRKSLCNIVLALLLSVAAYADDTITVDSVPFVADKIIMDTVSADTVTAKPKKQPKKIYYGTIVKLDILSPIIAPALNEWAMQQYEVAVNVRLARRFYPTLELGYAGGRTHEADSVQYNGKGGFFRVGCDINPLKKHPESPHALLIGVRIGTSVQGYDQYLTRADGFKAEVNGGRADCWGEIILGCQVEIAKVKQTAFYMGWMGRFKFLFTRKEATDRLDEFRLPIYIPGYGTRDNVGWGANYYLGWRF